MKLFKAEHYERGIWYFSTKAKLCKYIDTAQTYLNMCLKNGKHCKGWAIEEIEDDNILSRYIDPERKLRDI